MKKRAFSALGEILLIIIGVFLGLQVDKCSEQRKDEDREKLILNDIKSDLLACELEIKENIDFNSFSLNELKKVQQFLQNDKNNLSEITSSLSLITEWKSPYMTSVAYQTFKGKELGLIKNDKLKKEIIKLNELSFTSLLNDYDNIESDFSKNIVWPMLINKMEPIQNSYVDGIQAKDFTSLKEDSEFAMMIRLLIQLREKGVLSMQSIQADIKNLIDLINEEINYKS